MENRKNKQYENRGKYNEFETLDKFAGEKKNISNNIYKDKYDYTDVQENYKNFTINRNRSISNLPVYKESPRVDISNEERKDRMAQSIERKLNTKKFINKEDFFKDNRNVLFEKPPQYFPMKALNSVHDSSIKSDIFIKKIRHNSNLN